MHSGRGQPPTTPQSRRQISQQATVPNPLQPAMHLSDYQSSYGTETGSNTISPLLHESRLNPRSALSGWEKPAERTELRSSIRPFSAEQIADDTKPLPGGQVDRTKSHGSPGRGVNLLTETVMPGSAAMEDDEGDDPTEDDIAAEVADLDSQRFRLWVFPAHINDQEAEGLMKLFPRSIPRRKDVRIPFVRPGRGAKDLETGSEGWRAISVEG